MKLTPLQKQDLSQKIEKILPPECRFVLVCGFQGPEHILGNAFENERELVGALQGALQLVKFGHGKIKPSEN